ncbi:Short-chain dehydrogenase virD [Cladobotryum mycophilum]|uniref:Short-chain dehydrogenase virD n=1 Tax=Cladobotryum mycophilum TaxID=491253 RepID=A0ABR0SXH4_9HYPO
MASDKKFVLITGCTPGGIGHALALEFQKRGCHVIATARKASALQSLTDLGMSAISLEVTNPESIAACKAEVETITGGRLDVLINNAGRGHTIPATDIELDDVRATYEANVFGPMLMCQAFIPLLIPARGLIINVSSISSVVPYLFRTVYSSTKGALNTYSRALRLELKPFNVRVMVAMAGTVKSNIGNHVKRQLPSTSIFRPIEDVFMQRLAFSQTNATMPTEVFARQLVNAALKGEGYLGGLIGGSPNWFWAGGLSTLVRTLTWLPDWASESITGVFFGIRGISQALAAARAKLD